MSPWILDVSDSLRQTSPEEQTDGHDFHECLHFIYLLRLRRMHESA
jgi:hypothetical protein